MDTNQVKQKVNTSVVVAHTCELSASSLFSLQLLGFGTSLLDGIDPNPENFVMAGIVHTRDAQIGCLLRLEPNKQAQVGAPPEQQSRCSTKGLPGPCPDCRLLVFLRVDTGTQCAIVLFACRCTDSRCGQVRTPWRPFCATCCRANYSCSSRAKTFEQSRHDVMTGFVNDFQCMYSTCVSGCCCKIFSSPKTSCVASETRQLPLGF